MYIKVFKSSQSSSSLLVVFQQSSSSLLVVFSSTFSSLLEVSYILLVGFYFFQQDSNINQLASGEIFIIQSINNNTLLLVLINSVQTKQFTATFISQRLFLFLCVCCQVVSKRQCLWLKLILLLEEDYIMSGTLHTLLYQIEIGTLIFSTLLYNLCLYYLSSVKRQMKI